MPNFRHTNECPGYNKLDELGQIERTEKMDCNKTSHKIADSLLQAPVQLHNGLRPMEAIYLNSLSVAISAV